MLVGMTNCRMIRVGGIRGSDAVMYAVAEPDAYLDMKIIRAKVAKEGDHLEDLGRIRTS